VGLRSRPASTSHRLDHGCRHQVVKVAGGRGDAAVAKLAGDDADVDTFGAELSGVGVAESVGVDTLVDVSRSVAALLIDSARTESSEAVQSL